MAEHSQTLTGDPDELVQQVDDAIVSGSVTASLEHGINHQVGDARMLVRVYERYSAMGGNRVSLCLSVLAVGDQMSVSAVTAGGSQAAFFKVNTVGEESFLEHAVRAIQAYEERRPASYLDEDGR